MKPRIKFKENIDIKKVIGNRFIEHKYNFSVYDDIFDEGVIIEKETRHIYNNGFTCMIQDWFNQGFLEIIS